MSRELIVAWAGRHQRNGWDDLCADYRGRIERFLPVRDLVVKVKTPGSSKKAKTASQSAGIDRTRLDAESKALLASLPASTWLIALDRRGTMLSSEDLARQLTQLRNEWPHPIAFVIGSDLGLGQEVLNAARLRFSFGKLTLPHELARLVLYEQLYRALSIEAGINYHRVPL